MDISKHWLKKMLDEFKGRVDELRENFNSIKKYMEIIKKNQS